MIFTKPNAHWAVIIVKRTRCGAAVVAAMRGWWRHGVGCDEVMIGTVMWYGVDGDGAAVDL
ncbi:hypothetical protein Tco_0113385, partial [Tanacetum coccineum]